MKRNFLVTLILALAAISAPAATPHTGSVAFPASSDSTPTNPGTTQIYWAPGACPASGLGSLPWNQATASGQPSYTVLNPYVITLPSPGTYCFYVTFTTGGATSAPSNTAGGSANPFPTGSITVTVQ